MDNYFENIKNMIYLTTIHVSDLHHYDHIQYNIHHGLYPTFKLLSPLYIGT